MDKRCICKKLCMIIIGVFILSFGIYNFYYQNGITEGGVLGILLILKNIFEVEVSISSIIIDGILILLGLKVLGKEFFGYTLFASFVFSVIYGIFEKVGFLVTVNSNLLAAILGGASVGVGCAIIMNAGGASGGEDALAIVLSKLLKFKIGIIYLISDVSVLLLSLVYLPIRSIMYSVVAVIISGQVINLLYKEKQEKAIPTANGVGNRVKEKEMFI